MKNKLTRRRDKKAFKKDMRQRMVSSWGVMLERTPQ